MPDRLMQAIGLVESGRRDPKAAGVRPWPWTINAENVGSFYDTKEQAIAAVQALQARGVRSIDVGCMQVNLMHHADAFASLEEAFDPRANVPMRRGSSTLFAQTGDLAQAPPPPTTPRRPRSAPIMGAGSWRSGPGRAWSPTRRC